MEDNLKLEKQCDIFPNRYVCSLTKELDTVSNITEMHYYNAFRHYILMNSCDIDERILPIRVPGGTVGCICFDENNVITKVEIDTKYVVKTYPSNVKELVQKYAGEFIEWQ